MYYIFLDTNIFVANFQLNSQANTRLLKYAKRGDIKICITYTNYLEILKKFEDTIRAPINKIKSENAKFNRHFGKPLFDEIGTPNEYLKQYKSFLDDLLEQAQIDVIEHTSDFTNKIIMKFFNNEKPFSATKPEFRDAIIWETILDFYQSEFDKEEDKIFFLTYNVEDFAKEVRDDEILMYILHDNLLKEMPELIIYKDVKEFLENEIDELHDYLEDNFEIDENEITELIKCFFADAIEVQLAIDYFIFNYDFDGKYFSGWGEDAWFTLEEIDIIDYSRDIEDGILEIDASLQYEIDFTIVTKNPFYEREDDDDSEFLRDESGNGKIELNAIISIKDDEIITHSIEGIHFI